jgi:MoxR-like ATPase
MLQHEHPVNKISPVVSAEELVACQTAVRHVHVAPQIRQYLLEIIHATRDCEDLGLGASPRGSISLFRTCQALAAMRGRDYVQPDDIKFIVSPVLAHRVILTPDARLRKITAEYVIDEIVAEIAVPTMVQNG